MYREQGIPPPPPFYTALCIYILDQDTVSVSNSSLASVDESTLLKSLFLEEIKYFYFLNFAAKDLLDTVHTLDFISGSLFLKCLPK